MTELAIGIDGGGTSCRAAVADKDGNILGRGKAGPANILSDLENALVNIVESARQALSDAGLDAEVVTSVVSVVGVAGAMSWTTANESKEPCPLPRRVVTDALISLQARSAMPTASLAPSAPARFIMRVGAAV